MQGRLTFCLIPQLLICTSAFAQSTTPADTAERTFWDHNGSVMYLVANGSSREFYYQKPRPGMLEAGAHPDSLLFRGQIDNGQFSGTAYLFNAHCGQVPFEVKGPVLDNGGRVALTGQAPHVGRNCQASGYYTSTLEFRLLKSTEVEQPPQPSKTAQAPNVEEPKPEVPWSDVGEPKPPGAPSAQPPATARTPPLQPSPTTQVPIATEDFGDQRLLAPVIIAMNVVLPCLSIGILRRNSRAPRPRLKAAPPAARVPRALPSLWRGSPHAFAEMLSLPKAISARTQRTDGSSVRNVRARAPGHTSL
jgi:hypothetical protein